MLLCILSFPARVRVQLACPEQRCRDRFRDFAVDARAAVSARPACRRCGAVGGCGCRENSDGGRGSASRRDAATPVTRRQSRSARASRRSPAALGDAVPGSGGTAGWKDRQGRLMRGERGGAGVGGWGWGGGGAGPGGGDRGHHEAHRRLPLLR